jgi:acyl carrier protein
VSLEARVIEMIATLLDADAGDLNAAVPLAGIEGWDSVNALRVLMYLERSAGVALDYERFSAAVTIAGLIAVADEAIGRR